jgi:hypothetical protein
MTKGKGMTEEAKTEVRTVQVSATTLEAAALTTEVINSRAEQRLLSKEAVRTIAKAWGGPKRLALKGLGNGDVVPAAELLIDLAQAQDEAEGVEGLAVLALTDYARSASERRPVSTTPPPPFGLRKRGVPVALGSIMASCRCWRSHRCERWAGSGEPHITTVGDCVHESGWTGAS